MKKNKSINKQNAKALVAALKALNRIKEIYLIKKQTIEAENERLKLGGQFPSFEKSIENTGAIIIHNKIKKRKCLLSGLIKTDYNKLAKDIKIISAANDISKYSGLTPRQARSILRFSQDFDRDIPIIKRLSCTGFKEFKITDIMKDINL